ncbi:DUF927 domain-containing protein [Streptomyces scopuliridis]|uniref:DUF927 domain-containing protein n=1 Tax=Streptomyces scopuliridis TaxID=452529 RepID=A0ACD4ZZM8_9ACTN|nr:DUF927 domain-containing protein [Streptomyces scopuliridis]WSC03587.1 DUF927 domain-containing protein [Streptomyces scopuliridis]
MNQQQPQTSESAEIPAQQGKPGKVRSLDRGGVPAGCRSIAGMKRGWYYREADRMILHRQNPEDAPLPIGQVPRVTGQIIHLTDDGQDIRSEYLVIGKRQKYARILTEDELDKGTWAAKCGARRPTGNDERHAFARLIREEGDKAPEIAARTYYTDDGDLVLPDATAQTLGYRTLRGTEEEAREAWDEIGAWLSMDGKSALVAGAFVAAPVMDSLDMLAHMVSVHGPGQQGKSTILVVCASCYGDLKPRRQQLMTTWNSSKQGITQSLRQRGYLPVALDEHSSSGRTIKESSREISQMVAGAIRAMGTADGSPRESDGFWHSVILSSSNEPLKHEGQTEDLATRLQEFKAPFFPNKMVDADGAPAEPGHRGAEHISKRLKRLAKDHGGWPVEWAVQMGMYRAENLKELRRVHLELCAKYRPAQGGVAATIAELHMAWVVGAHMLGLAIGVPTLGAVAETEAAARLAEAIEISAEANIPDHEKLWSALDALRIEKSAFPDIDKAPSVAEDGFRRLRGFINPENGEWWVVNPVVHEAGTEAGIDNVSAALRELDKLKVHIRGKGKHAQRQLPKHIRYAGLGERMHCFDTRRAAELFSPDDQSDDGPGGGSGGGFPSGATPGSHPGATGVAPENGPLTSSGATGATGATPQLVFFNKGDEATPGSHPGTTGAGEVTASRAHDVTTAAIPPMPSEPPTVPFPAARMYQPGDERLDDAWLSLEVKAKGRTRSALNFGVLGNGRLFLPNHEPVHVPPPGHVDQVPALMQAYGLKTLYIHEEALAPLGLPTFRERQHLAREQEREAKGLGPDDYVRRAGPQSPAVHPWSTPGAGSPIESMRPAALVAWMTLVLADPEGKGSRLSVAIPAYDDRIKKAKQSRLGGLAGPETPEILLDTLMVWTLSTVHGSADYPKVHPYYLSPNRTAEDFAGGRTRTDVVSEAIRARQVPPADHDTMRIPTMVPQKWEKPVAEFTNTERAATWIQEYDKTAAWLAAFSNVRLGIGEPSHFTGGAIAYNKMFAGYWRVAEIPGTRDLPGMPPLVFEEAEEGGYWVATPSMDLLLDMWPTWDPQILEAWVWETSKRALEGFYTKVKDSRVAIVAAAEAGRPGAKWAKQINGSLYQSFRGYLGRTDGPQTDHATGGAYSKDIYWRPDWAYMLLSHATANMYRNLRNYARDDQMTPLYVNVDAAGFASDHQDPEQAKPAGMRLGSQGGEWTAENTAPLDQLLYAFEDEEKNVHVEVEKYTAERGE